MHRLAAAHDRVRRAEALLGCPSPPALDACSAELEAAVALAQAPGPALLADAEALRATVRRASRLLEKAAQYHAQWSRIVGAMCSGYTAAGATAAPPPAGRLAVSG